MEQRCQIVYGDFIHVRSSPIQPTANKYDEHRVKLSETSRVARLMIHSP